MVNGPLADTRDMYAVHTLFRREFGLMPQLVRDVADDDETRVALVADHVTLLTMVLTAHHAAEDKHVWPLLRERGASEIAFLVGVMEEQHEAIHRTLVRLQEAVAVWRTSRDGKARDTVAEAIDQLIPATNDHLALEEARVVPLIGKHLTADEYSQLATEAASHFPPDLMPIIVGMFMYEAQPEVIGMVIEHMPPEIRPIINDLAAKAYAVYAQELYGTPTPPRVTA